MPVNMDYKKNKVAVFKWEGEREVAWSSKRAGSKLEICSSPAGKELQPQGALILSGS